MESIANWLEAHALPCPAKAVFSVECPGCGFQSALADLLRGDLAGCWEHYPPLLPFLLTILLLFGAVLFRYPGRLRLLVASFALTCAFILVNYSVKMLS